MRFAIDIEEYRRLSGEVVARDRAARLGRSERGARLLADLAGAEESGDHGRAAVMHRAVTAIFADVARHEVARWRQGPSDDDVMAVLVREVTRHQVLVDRGGDPGVGASAALAEHLAADPPVAARTWLSDTEVAAVVADAIREAEADGPATVDRVMALVRPRVSDRAYLHDVLREVERRLAD